MRLSGLREALTRPNGHKDLEAPEAAHAVEQTTSPEPVDEEIESLLVSLEEKPQPVRGEEPYSASERRERRERRSPRRGQHGRYRVNQFDLFFAVTAVMLGFAVGLVTVFLVNG